MIGVFSIQKSIPGVTAAGNLKEMLIVGGTTEDIWIAEVIRKNHIGWGILVRSCGAAVRHKRQAILIFLNVKLQRETDLVKVTQASSRAPGFLGAPQSRQEQSRQQRNDREDHEQLD